MSQGWVVVGKAGRGDTWLRWLFAFGAVGAFVAVGLRDARAEDVAIAGSSTTNTYALSFTWNAPNGCPSRAAVLTRARELGDSEFSLAEPTAGSDVAVVQAEVSETAGQFEVRFDGAARGQPFTRQLHTSTCDEAAEATALLLAMMVQTDTVARETAVSAAPSGPGSSVAPATAVASFETGIQVPLADAVSEPVAGAAEPPTPPPTVTEVRPPTRKPIATALPEPQDLRDDPPNLDSDHWAIGAAVSASQAMLPTTAPGVIAHLGYEYRWLRVAMEGSWLPRVDQRLRDTPAVGARVGLWAAAVRTWFWQPVKLGSVDAGWLVTLAGEAGKLRGEAYGTDHPVVRSVSWFAGSAGVGGLVKIVPNCAAVMLVEAVVPFRRTEFNLRNVGAIDAPAAVGARGRLGIEVQF